MRVLAPLLAACLLGGCASWPEHGSGGYAERRPVADEQLNLLAGRYETLRSHGAERWVAGLSEEARIQFIRAQRNQAAGLDDDFADDKRHLTRVLDQIEQHLRNRKP